MCDVTLRWSWLQSTFVNHIPCGEKEINYTCIVYIMCVGCDRKQGIRVSRKSHCVGFGKKKVNYHSTVYFFAAEL